MPDPIEETLAIAHTELDRFMIQATPWGVGSTAKIRCKSPPVIVWTEEGGDTTKELEANTDGHLFNSPARLTCFVWGVSKEQTWKLWWNLQIACLRKLSENITFQSHSTPIETEPGQGYRGFVIEAKATVIFHIPNAPFAVPGYPTPLPEYTTRPVVRTTSTAELDT